MKTIVFLLTFGTLATAVYGGTIKDLVTNHPDQWQTIMESGSYTQMLQFIQSAYTEYQANPKDGVLQYAYLGALDKVSAANPVAISLDFTLNQPDMNLREIGAHTVYQAVLKGVSMDQATRDRLVTKLKADIGELKAPSQEAFQFARYGVYALMLLGDDIGLDDFLTDKTQVRNLSVKDDWDAKTEAAHFQQLTNQYTQLASSPGTRNNDWQKTVAAFYRLAEARRAQGEEVKPLHPTVDLDGLKKR